MRFFKSIPESVLITVLVVLVSVVSFALGRISVSENASCQDLIYQEDLFITDNCPNFLQGKNISDEDADASDEEEEVFDSTGTLVGSKNSDKYHYPWCPGALRIKDENKVWFASKEEAEKAGYVPAKNCPGLE